MLKALLVVGARPNFMKVAPILREMRGRANDFAPLLVHTGQHYDAVMSDAFFRDLNLPEPDFFLGVGGGSHAAQTARVMLAFEPIVESEKPDWVVVVGDVNSTLACALVCTKLGVRVAHVEAGLRSYDRGMPEEVNRVLTDQISDLLLTTSLDANDNLQREGIAPQKIKFVGNVMIDSLLHSLTAAAGSTIRRDLQLENRDYAVLTLHRPSNVDDKETLRGLLDATTIISRQVPVIFPIHPRTSDNLRKYGLHEELKKNEKFHLIEPLGYLDFLFLYSNAKLVLTDSGGLQEETTALGVPCLTLRENTERPITIEMGTNRIVGTNPEKIVAAAIKVLQPDASLRMPRRPPLWDGNAAARICDELLAFV